MDATLFLPALSDIPAAAHEAILKQITEQEFCQGWDGPEITTMEMLVETQSQNEPPRSRAGEGESDVDAWIGIARAHGFPIAVHVDGSNGRNTHEWEDKSFVAWFNPKTGVAKELPAACLSHEPRLTMSEALEMAHCFEKRRAFYEEMTLLADLRVTNKIEPLASMAACLQEFDSESGEFSPNVRKALVDVTSEGIRLTLGDRNGNAGDDQSDLFVEASAEGWLIFAHENAHTDPAVKISIPDGEGVIAATAL